MKYLFKNILSFFATFIFHLKKSLCFFAISVKNLFSKEPKKRIISSIILFSSLTVSYVSSAVFSEFLPGNRCVYLSRIANSFEKDNKYYPNLVVYSENLLKQEDYTNLRNPELTKKYRNIHSEVTCFDFYLSSWNDQFFPCCVDYLEDSNVPISFLMWPTENNFLDTWAYKMPTLSRKTSRLSTPNGLYINTEYADRIISENNLPSLNYDSIIGVEVELSYNYRPYSNHNENNYVAVKYVIEGVIDSSSIEYKNYEELFGDFFIVNENFSLPFPCETFIKIKKSPFGKIEYYRTLLDIFDYNSTYRYLSNGSMSKAFSSRVAFFGERSTPFSIFSIFSNPSIYNARTNKMFEIFESNTNSILLIIFACISVSFFLFSILYIFSITKLTLETLEFRQARSLLLLFVLLEFSCMFFGLCFAALLGCFWPFNCVFYQNYIGVLIILFESLILLFEIVFHATIFYRKVLKKIV